MGLKDDALTFIQDSNLIWNLKKVKVLQGFDSETSLVSTTLKHSLQSRIFLDYTSTMMSCGFTKSLRWEVKKQSNTHSDVQRPDSVSGAFPPEAPASEASAEALLVSPQTAGGVAQQQRRLELDLVVSVGDAPAGVGDDDRVGQSAQSVTDDRHLRRVARGEVPQDACRSNMLTFTHLYIQTFRHLDI